MEVDDEDFTDEGGGTSRPTPTTTNPGSPTAQGVAAFGGSVVAPRHVLHQAVDRDEPLDMSVGSMRESGSGASNRHSSQEILRVQQEPYSERDGSQYNPQQLQSQQQAMRAFFPDIISPSPSDSMLLSSDVQATESSNITQLNRPVYASATVSTITSFAPSHDGVSGPQPAHQATQQAVTHHHPHESSLLSLPSYSSMASSSSSAPVIPVARSATSRFVYYQGPPQLDQHQLVVSTKENQYNARNNDEPQAKVIRSSSILLHPSLRNLSPHSLAVVLLRQDKLEVAYNLKQKCIENFRRDPDARPVSKVRPNLSLL